MRMTDTPTDTPLVDYYFTLVSPWAYIGHDLFMSVAAERGAAVRFIPVNLGEVFPNSGGLPLAKRHPHRVAYRMMELQRWREKRGLDFVLKPAGWPFDPTLADCCVIALTESDENPDDFISAAFKAVFEAEKNLGQAEEIEKVLNEVGHDGAAILQAAASAKIKAKYAGNAQEALTAGVFGSPSYVREGEIFWGQDRIELLDDALATGRASYKPAV
jgi:2-hydroxychromene-2-carboxylate isomerase